MHNHHNTSRSRGFTLVELLVLIAIIVLLIGILMPVALRAMASARDTSGQSMLRTLETGIEQFKSDLGYAPPLLGFDNSQLDRGLIDPAARRSGEGLDVVGDRLQRVRWHSVLSLPIYLLGADNVLNEGFEPDDDPFWNRPASEYYLARHDGQAGFGFRDPGRDRSWGGALNRNEHNPPFEGRVYGPYIDTRLADHLRPSVQDDFVGGNDMSNDFPFSEHVVLRDFWDNPIRYYRSWPVRDLINESEELDFRHGPAELLTRDEIEPWLEGPIDKPLQPRTMLGSEFALLSAGRDRLFGDAVGVTSTNPANLLTPAIVYERDEFSSGDTDESRSAYLDAIDNNLRVTR